MKSGSKKQKHSDKSPFYRNEPITPKQNIRTQQSIVQDEYRRYSQIATQQALPIAKRQNRQSRMTNIKSQHPDRKRSVTPGSQVSSVYMTECQNRYKQLLQIMKKQHENISHQNIFLQQQIRGLYQRQARHKQTIRRYKQQIKFLKLQNEIYQQRYTQIKTYINSVVDRMAQLTVIGQDEDKEMFRNSSLQMVAKLKLQLSHYEDYNDGEKQLQAQQGQFINNHLIGNNYENKNAQSQFFVENHNYAQINEHQDATNNFIHTQPDIQQIVDLKETRFIKDPKYNLAKAQHHSNLNKKIHKLPTFNKTSEQNYFNRQSQQDYLNQNYDQQYFIPCSQKHSSTPNSDQKTIDNNFKPKNFLQDTSESNCLPAISHQIEQLTDQSEALMYELKKTNNQDSDIKKKIIRISQKIRQLKIESSSMGEQQKFTSLQNINSKQQSIHLNQENSQSHYIHLISKFKNE